jgi:cytoskeletal protein RodZ
VRLPWRNRTQTTADVPAELEQYYNQPVPKYVWALRFVALLLLLAILFAIGWAAQAVYHSLTDDNKAANTQNGTHKTQTAQNKPKPTQPQNNGTSTNNKPQASGGSSSQQAPGTAPSPNPSPSPEPAAASGSPTPAAQPTPTEVPKTGPEDVVVPVAGAVMAGTAAHAVYSRRKLARH